LYESPQLCIFEVSVELFTENLSNRKTLIKHGMEKIYAKLS